MRLPPAFSWSFLIALALAVAGCPGGGDVRDDRDQAEPVDAGVADAGAADAGQTTSAPERAPLNPIPRPTFDPDAPAPCKSHTACYLDAKQAHETGSRGGYLLALDRCEFYRGSYQLEEFYGLCLLILADAYRHLDNFDEAAACYQRFLDTNPGAGDLALQARTALDEVTRGKQTPYAYREFLEALALLTQYATSNDRLQIERAHSLLESLSIHKPDWFLADKVKFLLGQVAGVLAPKPTPQEPDAPAEPTKTDGAPPAPEPPAAPAAEPPAEGADASADPE